MLNVTHNGRPVWGPTAVNGALHHAALRCHTSGIQWHHWETMLLQWSSEPQQQRVPVRRRSSKAGHEGAQGTHPQPQLPSRFHLLSRLHNPLLCPLLATPAREFPLTAFPSQPQDERKILIQP